MWKKIWKWIEKNELLVLLLILVTFFRIPSLYEPGWYGDEGIYLVLGDALRKGLVWYRDIHDNKPPLLYLLAALTGSVTYFRTLLIVWSLATIVVFEKLARKIIDNRNAQNWALITFAVLTTIPTFEGNIANAEIFMILPTILGVWWLIKGKLEMKQAFVAGVWFGLAFLFKVPAIFEAAGIGIWMVLTNLKNGKWFRLGIALTAGILVPVLITFVYYFAMGAGPEYIRAAFMQNFGYLSSWSTGSHSGSTTQSGLMQRGMALMGLLVGFLLFFWKGRTEYKLVWIWLGFSLFGALLSERPYPHYLIQVLASFSLLVQMNKKGWKEIVAMAMMLLLLVGAMVKYKFYYYPTASYYAKFWQMITGQITIEKYEDSFDWRVNRNRDLTRYLRWTTDENERIFVWGDEPFVYSESDRLPVGKYAVTYHVIDFKAGKETMDLLNKQNPSVVVKIEGEKRMMEGFEQWLASNYVEVKRFEDAIVYKRVK